MYKTLTLCAALALPNLAMGENAAVIIGVSDYENYSDVRNASRAVTAGRALERIGFAVEARADATRRQTLQALLRMLPKLEDAERAIVVLNGNFLNYGGSNWFLAADAGQPTVMNIGDHGIYLGSILDVLAEVQGGAILILGENERGENIRGRIDAGLGDIDIPQGVTVIRGGSTEISQFARDSLSDAGTDLIAAARAGGLTIEGYTPRSLTLLPQARGFNDVFTPFDDAPQVDLRADLAAWDAANAAKTVEGFADYLRQFPRGNYSAEARAQMTELQNDPAYQAKQAEDALNLTRDQRRQIQAALTALSYDTRGVDGLFGRGSRRAITSWQNDQGVRATGYLSEAEIREIVRQARAQRARAEEDERLFWSQTGAKGGVAQLQTYLQRYPEGQFADRARQQLEQQSNAQNEQARAGEQALNLSPVIIGLIELQLTKLGINPGAMDGRLDENGRAAVQEYQRQQGLPQTGYISREVIARLINR